MSGKSRCTQQPQAAEGSSSGAPAQALHSPLPPAQSADVNTYDTLRLGLNRAVAVTEAMGGMVHLGPLGSSGLYLAVESNVEGPATQRWEEVDRHSPQAPAYAVRTNAPAWAAPTSPEFATCLPGVPSGAGLLSVPIPVAGSVPVAGSDEPLGVLSVFTSTPEEPALQQQLTAVADWIADCLGNSPGPPQPEDAGRPADCDTTELPVGFWGWDFGTGTVIWDDAALGILGIDAKGFDGQIRTWRRLVHPQDLPQLLARADEAIRARTRYQAEFRVRRPDADMRRVEVRGQASSADDGSGPRLAGIVRDITSGHPAKGAAEHALRPVRCGFLAVDRSWRIIFADPEAERLLAPSRQWLGQVLWDAVPALCSPGMEEVGRQAAAEGRPTELDTRKHTGRRLHVRLAPSSDGLTLCITDISSIRHPQADEASADDAAVERTMRIVELTRALAGAVTGHDVADVMATHMVPLFGAKGVGVWTHENGRAFLMGSAGPKESLRRFEGARVAELPPSAQAFIEGTLDFICSAEEFISRFPALADLPAASGTQAWAILPLIASGRTVGASCVSYEHPHAFSHEERTLFTAMSGMVAQAMERARLYDAEHRRAQELQCGLLPRRLPALPAVTASARYRPAGDGTKAAATGMTSSHCRPSRLLWSLETSWGTACPRPSPWADCAPRAVRSLISSSLWTSSSSTSTKSSAASGTAFTPPASASSTTRSAACARPSPPAILRRSSSGPTEPATFRTCLSTPRSAPPPRPSTQPSSACPTARSSRSTPTASSNPADWTSPKAWAASPANSAPHTFR